MIVSQNVDGLHRKSGIHPDKLAELHGNTNLELCLKCGKEHMRDFKVRCAKGAHKHQTGRKCEKPACGGNLKDSIINFGDSLDQPIIDKATKFCSNESDLIIAMGSSMRVQPACSLPLQVIQNGGNFVMINLQKTPLDAYACLCIHAKTDDVMKLLMKKLGYDVPNYTVKRKLQVTLDAPHNLVSVAGLDTNGAGFTICKKVTVKGLGKTATDVNVFDHDKKNQPYRASINNTKAFDSFELQLEFFAHYKEPNMNLTVPLDMLADKGSLNFHMEYDLYQKKWTEVQIRDKEGNQLGQAQYN